MEQAMAYVCCPAEESRVKVQRYCRKIYELGYVPICPDVPLNLKAVPDGGGLWKRGYWNNEYRYQYSRPIAYHLHHIRWIDQD